MMRGRGRSSCRWRTRNWGCERTAPEVPRTEVPGTRYQGEAPGNPVSAYRTENAVSDEAPVTITCRGGLSTNSQGSRSEGIPGACDQTRVHTTSVIPGTSAA